MILGWWLVATLMGLLFWLVLVFVLVEAVR